MSQGSFYYNESPEGEPILCFRTAGLDMVITGDNSLACTSLENPMVDHIFIQDPRDGEAWRWDRFDHDNFETILGHLGQVCSWRTIETHEIPEILEKIINRNPFTEDDFDALLEGSDEAE